MFGKRRRNDLNTVVLLEFSNLTRGGKWFVLSKSSYPRFYTPHLGGSRGDGPGTAIFFSFSRDVVRVGPGSYLGRREVRDSNTGPGSTVKPPILRDPKDSVEFVLTLSGPLVLDSLSRSRGGLVLLSDRSTLVFQGRTGDSSSGRGRRGGTW